MAGSEAAEASPRTDRSSFVLTLSTRFCHAFQERRPGSSGLPGDGHDLVQPFESNRPLVVE